MSSTSEAARRPQSGGRRGRSALVVGDHVGAPAGDAAQAVRRAGMRPALDRSFGHSAAETGTVVEQDPAAGSEVARNAMVTLYVAAPQPGAPVDSTGEPGVGGNGLGDETDRDDADAASPPVAWGPEGPHGSRAVIEEVTRADVTDAVMTDEFTVQPVGAEDLARSGFEDPFSRDAKGAAHFRHVYPRKPLGLTLRAAVRRVWRYRLAAIAALLLAAVLAGQSMGGGPGAQRKVARGATPAPSPPRPTYRRTGMRRNPSVSRRARSTRARLPHRHSVKPSGAPAPPPPVTRAAPATGPAAPQRPPGNAGGPFSP